MLTITDGSLGGEWLSPDDIRRLFEKHWMGSEDQLDDALEAFFEDIQGSYVMAMDRKEVPSHIADLTRITVRDYISNAYF